MTINCPLVFNVCHRGSRCKVESVQNGRSCRQTQQTTHTENIELLEVKGEQTFIFLTQSMDLLGKLLQDLRDRKPRTSKDLEFDIRETILLYEELSK